MGEYKPNNRTDDLLRASYVLERLQELMTPKGTPQGWVSASNAIKQVVLPFLKSCYNSNVLGSGNSNLDDASLLSSLVDYANFDENDVEFNKQNFGRLKYLLQDLFNEAKVPSAIFTYEIGENLVEAKIYSIKSLRENKGKMLSLAKNKMNPTNKAGAKTKSLESFL